MIKPLPRIIRSWIWLWLVLIVPLVGKAQLINIGTPAASCAGQSLTLLPGLTGFGGNLVNVSATSPAGLSVLVSTSSGIVISTSPSLATGTYNLTVNACALCPLLTAPPIVVPISINGLPVFSSAGPITGSLGSVVSLGTCAVGSVLNYVSSNGITGTGSSLSLVPALSGQSLSVVCTGSPCSSTTSILNIPVLSSALNAVQLGPVCVGQPLSLSLLPTGIDLTSPLVAVGVTGPGNLTVSALGPNGVLTISGLSSGTTTLTISVSVAGTQLVSIQLPVSVLPTPATPLTPSTLTTLIGSTLSLANLCPVGTTLGLPGLPLLGTIPISTSALGVQSLSLLCSNGTCVGLPNLLSLSVVAPILNAVTSSPICLGNILSLSVLPTNFGLPGAIGSLVSLSVTGPIGTSVGLINTNGVISISNLPTGGSNLTLTAAVAGNQVAFITVPVNVISLSAVTGLLGSQSVLQGTTLTLLGTCPTGVLSYTSSGGQTGTGNPTVPTGVLGAQSYTVVCIDGNNCISSVSVANITVVGGSLTPGTPGPICLGQILNLPLTGGGVLGNLLSPLVSLTVSGPANFSLGVVSPGSLVQLSGLPAGSYNLTVTAALSGTTIATVTVPVNIISLSAVTGLVASQSILQNTTLNLLGTCPTGVLSYTSSTGSSGTTTSGTGIPVNTGILGAQSYTVICLDANGCISPITVANITVVGGSLTPGTPGPICLGQILNLPLTGGGVLGNLLSPLVSLTVSGPANFSLGVVSPGSLVQLSGLPAGSYNLTVTAALSGTPIVRVTVPVNIISLSAVTGLVASQSILQNTTLNLLGTCPTGVLSYTSSTGSSGTTTSGTGIPVNTGILGAQSYTVICLDANGCISPITVANITVLGGSLIPGPNNPGQICLGQPLNLSLLGTGSLLGLPTGLVSLSVTGPIGVSASVLGPGLLQVTGLPAGTSNLTVTAALTGVTIATLVVPITVNSLAVVQNLASISALTGSTLNLVGTCPTGILSYTSSGGSSGTSVSGIIPVLTGSAGVQSYTVICLDANGCISPITVVNVTLVNGTLTPSGSILPICLGSPLNLTLIPGGGLNLGLVSLSVTGVANVGVNVGGGGVLTITNLPAGNSILTVTAYLLGQPVATVNIPVTVLSVQSPSVSSAPSIGQTYPAGATSVSVTQGQNNPVLFNASCSSGVLSYTGSNGVTGTTSPISVPTTTAGTISYSAVCTNGGCVSQPTIVNVVVSSPTNQPPTVIGAGIPSPQSGTVGIGFSSNVGQYFTDPDGNPLTFTSTPLPAGLTLSQGGVISGTPTVAGTTSVTITASDGQGGTAFDDLTLNISPAPNRPPVLVNGGIPTPQSGTVTIAFSFSTAPYFSDPDNNTLTYTFTGTIPPGLNLGPFSGVISGTPTTAGTYNLTITANDGQGGTVSDDLQINIAPAPNRPPTVIGAGIPSPQSGTVGIGFSSTISNAFTDPDGNSLTFTSTPLPAGLALSPAGVISGTPTVAGTTSVTITASDGLGGTAFDDLVLVISPANQPPTVVNGGIISPQTATVNTAFTTPTAYAFNDPDGGPLSYTATGLPAGLGINSTNGIISGVPSVTGSFQVTVTARDPQSASVSSTFTLNVVPQVAPNQPPQLTGVPLASPQSGTVGVAFSTTTAGAFVDPNGGPLSFTTTGLPNGVTINPTTGVISGTPTQSGSFPVIVTATDPQGASVSTGFTLNVSPANQSPTVTGTLTSPQFATVNTTFLTNTAQVFNDPDGGPLSFSATGLPTGLGIGANNGIITGAPSITGTFPITVIARDPQGATATAGFTLIVSPQTVANQPPQVVASLASPQSGTVGVPFTTTTAGAFVDPDGGPLSFTANGLPNGVTINPSTGVISGTPTQSGSFPVIVTATDPQGGAASTGFTLNVSPANQPPSVVGGGIASPQTATVNTGFLTPTAYAFNDPEGGPLTYLATGLPAGLGINSNNGIISGVPSVTGSFQVTVRATDPQNASVSSTFTLNVVPQTVANQPPQLTGVPLANPQSGTVGVAFSTTTAGAFVDPNGGPLSFTATGLPNGVTINPTTGVISGTPTQSGSFPIIVTATDPQGANVSTGFTLNISPANQPPSVVNGGITSPQTTTVNTAFVTPTAYAFNDPEGGPLSFTATGLPAGLGINPSSGIISGAASVTGTFTVTVTARDPQGAAASSSFILFVVPQQTTNQPPQLTGVPLANPQSATVGIPFTTTTAGAFVDPNGGPLSFSALGLPSGLAINPATGVISGTPTQSGSFPIIITATDPQGANASAGFILNVTPVNLPPSVVGGGLASPQTTTVNTAFVTPTAYAFNDPEGGPLSFTATGLPAGLGINPSSGIISGAASVTGTFTVTVTARDPQGASASSGFILFVVPQAAANQPPQVVGTLTSPQFATVNSPFTTQTAGVFFDVNPLTYSATGLPAGLAIIPSTGVITGSPSVTGSFAVIVTASDPSNTSASAGFTLIVSPQGVATTPLAVTVLSYNCQTGAIVFGRLGGDPNRAVEFLSIGVTGWSTSPNGQIQAEVRNDPNQSSITVFARYVNDVNSTVSFVFNFRAFCQGQGNNPPVYNGGLTNQVGTVGMPFTYTFPANVFTDPEGGTLTYAASGLPSGLSLSGRTISGTPSLSGTFGVTILAQDPQGASQSGTFLITINPAQVVGTPLAVTVLSYNCQTGDIVFGRLGGDPNRIVEFMAIGVRGFSTSPNARIEAELRSDPNQTSITIMARYVGDPSSLVTYSFNFRTGCAPTTNLPPVYNGGLPNQIGTVGVPFSYTLPATAFTDPEGQQLTFGAAGLPPGISLIGRVITGTPSQPGTYSPVIIFAFDPQNNYAQGTFTFTVNPASPGNQPPVVTGTIPNQTATVGIFYTYTIPTNVFTDPEGQTLTFSINGHPRRLEVNGRVISGFPLINGLYQITVTATDPQGAAASTSYLLTVLPNNTCGSDPNTIGQPLQLLQPDYNCQTGVIKFNTTGGNGGTITYAAIGITVPTNDCFDQMDTEVAQDVRNDKPNVEPFQIRAIQNGVFVQYAFDARAYCRNRAGAREAIRESSLDVTVLGNPTNSDAVEVEIRGEEGQPLRLRVADPMGAAISEQHVGQAGAVERVQIKLNRSTGIYLLQVNTPTKTKVVKIVRQ